MKMEEELHGSPRRTDTLMIAVTVHENGVKADKPRQTVTLMILLQGEAGYPVVKMTIISVEPRLHY